MDAGSPLSHGYPEPLCPSALGSLPAAWFLSHLSSSLPVCVCVYFRLCTDMSVHFAAPGTETLSQPARQHAKSEASSKPGSRTRKRRDKKHLQIISGDTLTLGGNTQGGQGHCFLVSVQSALGGWVWGAFYHGLLMHLHSGGVPSTPLGTAFRSLCRGRAWKEGVGSKSVLAAEPRNLACVP